MMNSRLLFSRLATLTLLSLVMFLPFSASAQDASESDDEPILRDSASLGVRINKQGTADIDLFVPLKVTDRKLLENSLTKAFTFPLHIKDNREIESFDDEEEESDEEPSYDSTIIRASGLKPFSDDGMQSTCALDLKPLLAVLERENIQHLSLSFLILNGTPETRVERAKRVAAVKGVEYYRSSITVRAPEYLAVKLSRGYSLSEILTAIGLIALFMTLPPLWSLCKSYKNRNPKDQAELWSRHLRFLNRLLNGIWILWLPVYSLSGAADILRYAIGPNHQTLTRVLDLGFYFVPPALILFLCHWCSMGIYRQITGVEWSPAKVVFRAIVVSCFSLMPLFLLGLVLSTSSTGLVEGVLFGSAGCLLWVLANKVLGKILRPQIYALTSGALLSRVYELANTVGVAIKQVYVLPDERTQLSNAFARNDNSLLITSSLLKNLNRREVDAIMAHEIGHLKEKHPQLVGSISIAIIVIMSLLGSFLSTIFQISHSGPIVFAIAMSVASFMIFFVSRRNERRADAIGVTLTGDPEAHITGLAKLSKLNLSPLRAGGWTEIFETHPRALRRFELIAQAHNISTERLQELLVETETVPADSYGAFTIDDANAVIFSSEFKRKYRTRILRTLLGVVLLGPIAFTAVLTYLNLPGFWLLGAGIAGFVFSFGLYQVVRNRIALWGQTSLVTSLNIRLAERGFGEVANEGMIVGLSPASETRKYEDYSFWDLGVMWLTREKLFYVGEQTQFAIDRERITDVYTSNTNVEWLSEKSLYVEWQANSEPNSQVLHFLAFGDTSVLSARRTIETYKTRIKNWLKNSEELSSVNSPAFEAPRFPEIQSIEATRTFKAMSILKAALQLAGYAALISIVIRLPGEAGFYATMVVFFCAILDEVPKIFHRSQNKTTNSRGGHSSNVPRYQRGGWMHSEPVK